MKEYFSTLIYIYIYILLLGTAMLPHDIVSAQGLSENMEILSAISRSHLDMINEAQGTHKVPH